MLIKTNLFMISLLQSP